MCDSGFDSRLTNLVGLRVSSLTLRYNGDRTSPLHCTIMFCNVFPIAATQPSWKLFIDAVTDHTNHSPTRGLDEQHLKLGPASFAQCIDLKNNPHNALREYNPHLAHIFVVLMCEGDNDFLRALETVREVIATSPCHGLIYVSASLDQWDCVIRRMLRQSMERRQELQAFFTECYGIFRAIGYKDLWNDLTSKDIGNNVTLLN